MGWMDNISIELVINNGVKPKLDWIRTHSHPYRTVHIMLLLWVILYDKPSLHLAQYPNNHNIGSR